jgi:heme exporter protein D
MDSWSVAVLVAAGYLAVMGLVRMMLARRNQLLQDIQRQIAADKKRQQAADEQQEQAA